MTFEERLQAALKAKGLAGKVIEPEVVEETTPVQEPPVLSEPTSPFPGMEVEELPVETETVAVEEPTFAGMEVEALPEEQVFDETTVVTPELIDKLGYEKIYDLSATDSPLAPEQRDILANALRGSSDLADILSGFDSLAGGADATSETEKLYDQNGVEIGSTENVTRTPTAGNIAVQEAVRKARLKFVADNPNTSDSVVSQVVASVAGGTAAPRPEGATALPAPTAGRAFTDTFANSALFGFADEVIPESKDILTADASRKQLREESPTAALAAELGGAVLSPSAGLAILGAAGKGLKSADTWINTVGKVAAATGIDTALSAAGNDGDITTEALIGSAMGGGIAASTKLVQLGGVLTSSAVKLLRGTKSEVETAEAVIKDLSKITNISADKLKTSILNSENIVEVLTKNGLSIEDAGKAALILAKQAPSNAIQTELRDNAKGVIEGITSKSSAEVQEYLKSVDPKDLGEEIGVLYKSQSGSDISKITKRLMESDASPMLSDVIRKAIAERTAGDKNILAGSGRSTVRADEILIDKETGGIFIPNEGAEKLTKPQMKETENMFGYAKDDLFEITDGDYLRGDVFQSADSKLAQKITYKEGEAPDQAFSETVTRIRKELKSVLEGSVENLGQTNQAYSIKKATKDTTDLTSAFVKKQIFSPADIDDYVKSMDSLSKLTDKEHKTAVMNGMKNFFGSNAKTTNLLTATGDMNPEFRKAMQKAGVSKAELDSFEKMAKDKVFFSEFLKSTGVKGDTEDLLAEGIGNFAARLFFNKAWPALKNTALSMIGRRAADGFDKTKSSKNYADLVRNLASLKEADFAKVQKLVDDKGQNYMSAMINVALAKGSSAIARTTLAQ
jgi:hypothetical protein